MPIRHAEAALGENTVSSPKAALSRREMQATSRLAKGMNASEVARDMGVPRTAAKNYLRRAAKKLGADGQKDLSRIVSFLYADEGEEATLP